LQRFLAQRNPEDRDALVMDSLALVHYTLGRMGISVQSANDYEDLVSQGILGLMHAVDHYDPAFGTQFSTYAILRIRGEVLDYLRANDRLSRSARQRAKTVQRGIEELWQENHRTPSDEELAAHLHSDVQQIQQALLDANRFVVSLDTLTTGDDGDAQSLYESVPDDKQTDPLDEATEQDLLVALQNAIGTLSDRDQLVLSLYYLEGLTFKEIGTVLNISESRVCQVHSRLIFTLKALLKESEPATPLTKSKSRLGTREPLAGAALSAAQRLSMEGGIRV
jgi:RNA polymerase sigma factor for flagellar operon FliA